jgi:hypothetical protein
MEAQGAMLFVLIIHKVYPLFMELDLELHNEIDRVGRLTQGHTTAFRASQGGNSRNRSFSGPHDANGLPRTHR